MKTLSTLHSAKHSFLTDLPEGLRRVHLRGGTEQCVCSPAVHVPSSANNPKVLVLGGSGSGSGWEEIRTVQCWT